MKIGIINSGGDTPGINAVIASVVRAGTPLNMEFVGFIKGWEGLLDKEYMDLRIEDIRGISHLGGTILFSVNKGRFAGKKGTGDVNQIPEEILDLAARNLFEFGIEALIVIGGDGTLSGAQQLEAKGIKIIGVPKTIDNDLNSTDSTFGFNTAVDIVTEALDRIHTTAYSHQRVIFVETMGRNAGWIALKSGLAGGADAILLPEMPFDYNSLINFLSTRQNNGQNYAVVVVAEGAHAKQESIVSENAGAAEVKLGGISLQIMETIQKMVPNQFEMRNVVLGHTQRGGEPNAIDRVLAKAFGVAAVYALNQGDSGSVVCLQGKNIVLKPISEVVASIKSVTEADLDYITAKRLGVSFGV